MSTDYNALNPIISSIRVEDVGPHCKITIFSNGQNCGTLCVGANDRFDFLNLFFTRDYAACASGGSFSCPVDMQGNVQLLSESGDLTTVQEASSGLRRVDRL